MKCVIQREELLKPLQVVKGVVENRQTLPILSNVLLRLQNKTLSLIGTDLEVELRGRVELENVPAEGEITVSARKLLDICRMLPEAATLEIYTEDQRVVVKSGRSLFNLAALPAKDFPLFEENPGQVEINLPQNKLRYLIENTHFAVAQQDVRYYLNGMLFDIQAQNICAVATDGHRLALSQVAIDNASEPLQVIVPRKGIYELLRLLDNSDEEVAIIINSNQIVAKTAHFSFTSKLIDGRFPDYHKVVPQGGDKVVEFKRDDLKQALSRVAILSNEKYKGVCLQLRRNLITVIATNPDQEEAREELAVQYDGDDLDIGFNVTYLLDVVNTVGSETLRWTFSDANNGSRIEPISAAEGFGVIYVVMPMRL